MRKNLMTIAGATLFLKAFLGSPICAEPSSPPSHLFNGINTSPTQDSRSLPTGFQRVGNVTLFGVHTATGIDLWRTDLTPEGTFRLKEFKSGSYLEWRAMVSGVLLFAAGDEANGFELWRTDGTEAGTSLVKDIHPGPGSSVLTQLTRFDGMLFFQLFDQGYELWKSDGTHLGTVMVKDVNQGPDSLGLGSSPFFLTDVEGIIYFAADDGLHGKELWKTDGTEEGTVLVKDIRPGPGASNPSRRTAFDGSVFFSADDGSHGYELWTTDGTSAGTTLVKDIYPGVWKSDGTEAGAVLVKDINPGLRSSGPFPVVIAPTMILCLDGSAPNVPTGLALNLAGSSQINLAWTATTDVGCAGIKGYNVYRNGTLVQMVPAPAISFSDTGLSASTTYSYTVSAVDNSNNESAQSAARSATTSAAPGSTFPPPLRTLWVDHNSIGGPCSDSRSASQVTIITPWCHLNVAGLNAQAGDLVYVRGGTYNENETGVHANDNSVLQVVNSGTSSAWIRFVAYNNERVTLQGSANACSLGGACHGVQVIKTYDGIVPQFVQIAGFAITGFDGNCITVQYNSDVVLSNLDVSVCHNGAVELHSTSRVTLEGSRVHDNHMMGGTSAVDLYQCNSGNVVRGNTIWQNYDDTAADSEGHGITMDVCGAAGSALIENNLIYNNEGWCMTIFKSDNAVIRNNVCWVNGIRSPSGEIEVYGNNMQVHNNIAVPRSGAPGLDMRYNSSYPVDITTLTEDYNIVWASTHTNVVMWSDGSSQGTVAQYQSANPRGWGAHDLQLDPILVDPSGARDFRPLAGSPAIDSGDNGHAAAVDFSWHVRPWDGDGNGSAIVDRGAFEYGSPY